MSLKYIYPTIISVILAGCGGGGSSSPSSNNSDSRTYTQKSIKVVDGYIKNADVLIDINTKSIGKYDDGDILSKTDSNGNVIIKTYKNIPNNVIIYAKGGINIATNEPFRGVLTSVYEKNIDLVVTPITTMVTAKYKSGEDLSSSKYKIAKALNIDESKLNSDPVKDVSAFKATQQIVAIANLLDGNNLTDTINKLAVNISSNSSLVDAVRAIDSSKVEEAKETLKTIDTVVDKLSDMEVSIAEKYIDNYVVKAAKDALLKGEDVEGVIVKARSIDSSLVKVEECLTFDIIKGENSSEKNIVKPLNLDNKYICEKDGVSIEWINADELNEERYEDKKVVLEAKISKNSMSLIKKFDLTLKATEKPVVASDDSIEVNEDSSVVIDVLENDKSFKGFDNIKIEIVTYPLHGSAIIDGKNIKYIPTKNFYGDDKFEYKISDDKGNSSRAKVNIKVLPINDAPAAKDIKLTASSDKTLKITLKATDVDSDSLKYTIIQNPTHGTASISSNVISYTADENYNGTDIIKYKVSDGELSSEATITINVVNNVISIDDDSYTVVELGSGDIDKVISINNESKNLYVLFTNGSKNSESIDVTNSAISSNSEVVNKSFIEQVNDYNNVPEYILKFNNLTVPKKSSAQDPQEEVVVTQALHEESEGDSKQFYTSIDDSETIDATLKKVVSDVDTKYGSKTLRIWVADNVFGDNCEKSKCLNQDMIDEMAEAFLREGEDNDIYDWVTNIFGEEWGSSNSRYVIGEQDEIDILLLDIRDDDSANGGTTGYFWSKDNFKNSEISGSNEKIMFYIDSVMYANRGDDGNDDFWKKRIFSTLAHEFQHMINFYQRNVKLGVTSDTWINEMLSVATQDVIATKIVEDGIRGIDSNDGTAGNPGNRKGRFPTFNENNDKSLTDWTGGSSYSLIASFGAYLTRNYDGVKILRDIQHYDSNNSIDSIVSAVNNNGGKDKSFDDILKDWGIGVMLSDFENLPNSMPRYNFGDFIYSTLDDITYELGSINFFNYEPKPKFHTTSGTINAYANYYYKVGEDLSGNVDINISIPSNVTATLIAK